MISLKKYSLLVFVLLTSFISMAQNSVGIAGNLTITPTNSVANSSTIGIAGYYQNTGLTTLTGTVVINLAINTSTNTTPNYVFRNSNSYFPNNFLPNAINQFYIGDNVSGANQYKTDGNGTTVVVWPVYNSDFLSTHDSAFSIVYIIVPNSVNEISEFENELLKINNPATQNVEINYDELIYKNVDLLSVTGQVVQAIQHKTLNVSMLAKGLYYLNFYNSETNQVITKKIMIE